VFQLIIVGFYNRPFLCRSLYYLSTLCK